jgi:plasmid stabilization system protein ParE
VVERIVAAVERLRDHPRSGRVVPELGDESVREVMAFVDASEQHVAEVNGPDPVVDFLEADR